MCPVLETKFQLNTEANEAYNAIWKTLKEMLYSVENRHLLIKSDLRVVKEFPIAASGAAPRKRSCVVLEYGLGWSGFYKCQIELNFKEIAVGTVVSLKWRYPSQEEPETTSLFEELKNRLAITEIASDEEPLVKEIIKEKQVIVKIRCPYCKNLYEETYDRCPHCGGSC